MSAQLFRLLGLVCILLFLVMPVSSEEQEGDLPTVPVEVTNFPDPQNVAGTVDVGNLPADEDGNLKVNVINLGETWKVVEVNSNLICPPGFTNSNIVEVAGYNRVSFHIEATDRYWEIQIGFRNKETETFIFTQYLASHPVPLWTGELRTNITQWLIPSGPTWSYGNFSAPVSGKEAVLIIQNPHPFDISASITAYLSR